MPLGLHDPTTGARRPGWVIALLVVALAAVACGLLRRRVAAGLAALCCAALAALQTVGFVLVRVGVPTLGSAVLAAVAALCFVVVSARAGDGRAGRSAATAWSAAAGAVAVLLLVPLTAIGYHRATTPRLPPVTSPPAVSLRLVAPAEADPALPPGPSTTVVAPPGTTGNGLLYVFLPGTGDSPGNYVQIQAAAARLGFHTLGLTYDNDVAVAARCTTDPHCHARVRQNVLTGTAPGDGIAVPPAEGIEHRLTATLRHLAAQYPGEGWDRFLREDRPAWSRTVFGGLSQGAGEAAYIGTVRPLAGETLFSSPEDVTWLAAGPPAAWLAGMATGKTPLERVTVFYNEYDLFAAALADTLPATGLDRFGPSVPVDTASAPYGNSHQLRTRVTRGALSGAWSHASTVADSATPRLPDGTARFLPVWNYMLRTAAGR